jgi:phosphate transport system protein
MSARAFQDCEVRRVAVEAVGGDVMSPLHTDRLFESQLTKLRSTLLEMGGLVEDQIAQAIRALTERDEALARATVARDHTVNRLDVEIDDLCLKLLALHQPAARDLRLITTALKITTDLERIGDLAEHIAERAVELSGEVPIKPYIDIPRMADLARDMLHRSLDAFVREDVDLALAVCKADDAVDKLHEQLLRELLSFMMENPATIGRATRLLFVSKYLERVGDHCTNIAEMVIFMVKGRSIRHMDSLPRAL